jgi:hypothetical protein
MGDVVEVDCKEKETFRKEMDLIINDFIECLRTHYGADAFNKIIYYEIHLLTEGLFFLTINLYYISHNSNIIVNSRFWLILV